MVSFLVFSFFSLSSPQRHPFTTDGADQREALTAYFSVLLAKYGASGDVRKICQIDVCVKFVNTQGVVGKSFSFFSSLSPLPNTPPPVTP